MKYKVFILEKRFYKWEIKANSQEEAKFLAQKFFRVASEREESFIENKIMVWACIKKEDE